MSLTVAQKEAVAARGNVLVVAGAGTGKTSTLVERCLSCLIDEKPPASLDEILMVTFTEAAAAEMRQRIRERLEKQLAQHHDRLRWKEELALFDTAHVGTLHSFCFQLVRQHFYELGLDPQLAVLPEEEAILLANETLDKVLRKHYAGETDSAKAVQQLIQAQARGWDVPIRKLVLRLHHYIQTLRDTEDWMESQLAMFHSPAPAQWQQWLMEGVDDWRRRWLPALDGLDPDNKKAAECAAILQTLPDNARRDQCAKVLEQVRAASQEWPRGKKSAWQRPLEAFFEEAAFLGSLAKTGSATDPLAEDWNWVRTQMTTLLELAREFTEKYAEAKRELGAVDFHDLEQHALRLLWDSKTKQPTSIAQQWREKLRFVFVDEYQDINEAQDAILKALSREGAYANRFLVGDVKQSIYRFRLADPRIFQNYVDSWRGKEGRAIALVDNFRSREGLLEFVNSVFGVLMRREIGGVPYDDEARLKFGDAEKRSALSVARDAIPRVELLLRLKGAEAANGLEEESTRSGTGILNLEEAGKDARLLAMRLQELRASRHLIWDKSSGNLRPVDWADMAVLLRSPSGKAEDYAREFTRLGVPIAVARGGFYESREITDMLSLLQLLDNPLQDLPVLAVLRSPLVGMALDELATIRLALPNGQLWTALQRYHETSAGHSGWQKADRFLKSFAAWRRQARQISLSRCLEIVLGETHYAEWLLTQSRGEQRHANLQRLLALARRFDQFQRQGLFRFLRFMEAQQEAETEPEVAAVAGENAVSLMSIHQSKGLEFPVVAVADLGKPFNLSDLHAEIILDTRYGLCPQIKPPHTGQRYPSLPYWLARQRQKQEMLGEEMRLLYVAMTRARDTLILSGNVNEKKFRKRWSEPTDFNTASLLAARSYLDWIAAWCANFANEITSSAAGESRWLRWTICDDSDKRLFEDSEDVRATAEIGGPGEAMDDKAWEELRERLEWQYSFPAATREPAKTSVSVLRRRLEDDEEKFHPPSPRLRRTGVSSASAKTAEHRDFNGAGEGRLTAEEIGSAHHRFLELVALEKTGTLEGLKQEARRMLEERLLTDEEIAHLDLPALAEFWQSDIGSAVRAQAKAVRRELAFTARFSPDELRVNSEPTAGLPADEFVVVQGVADLMVLLPKEIWLVDFKTDRVNQGELTEKVRIYEPQLRLYAQALERIYRRPVTRACLHFLSAKKTVEIETSNIQHRTPNVE
jgi:ATP-dependent helicase/nuclease subunit A